ncbi:MAG: hypothetical protein GF329_15785 [Candidatus Lokiarchaeota archaeon]|nr:hypothetical protein [Candidatus Lokiarchaeota archaeon]
MSNIADKIRNLKERVSELVEQVNSLKKQLETSSISLSEFKSKKESLQNELREILARIAEYKESADATPSTKKDSNLAEQSRDLMYYFQTEFDELTRARVYLSITLEKTFVITIDYSDYPERPKIMIPDSLMNKYGSLDSFLQKIPSYMNWDVNNPKKIYELITEIETVLINNYSADLDSIEQASIEYIENTKALISRLDRKARTELDVKNIDGTIEIYKSIIDLAYEIKDFKIVSDYTHKLDDLLRIVKKNK